MKTYSLMRPSIPSRCGLVPSPYYLSRGTIEIEMFDTYALADYFQNGKARFEDVLQKLYDKGSEFSPSDQVQLLFMLESLIHARTELDAAKSYSRSS